MEATINNLLPCATCPWRVDKDATTIPRYVHEKACNLMGTVGRDDGFRPIMACHHSTKEMNESETICKGYLAQAGWTNINVRLLLFAKKIPSPNAVADACKESEVELEPDYETVLEKLACSIEEID